MPLTGNPIVDNIVFVLKDFIDILFLFDSKGKLQDYVHNELSPELDIGDIMRGEHYSSVFGGIKYSFIVQFIESEPEITTSREIKKWISVGEEKFYFSIHKIPIGGFFIIAFQDYTALRMAEQNLLLNARIVDNLPFALICLDLDFNIAYWNSKAADYFRYKQGLVLEKPIDEILRMEYENLSTFEYRSAVYRDGFWKGMVKAGPLYGDAQPYYLESLILRNAANKIIGIMEMYYPGDLPHLKENELRTGVYDFKSLFENISVGFFVVHESIFSFLNDSFAKLLGYREEELSGTNILSLVDEAERDDLENKMNMILSGDSLEESGVFKFNHKNGITAVLLSLELTGVSLSNDISIVGLAKDVTEANIREEMKPEMVVQPEPDTSFVSDKEHDFRTYLNGIMGFSEILMERFNEFEDQSVYLFAQHINLASKRIKKLVEENPAILDYEAKKLGISLTSYQLSDLLQATKESCLKIATNSVARFHFENSEDLILNTDPFQLRRVILNIVKLSLENGGQETIHIDSGLDSLKSMAFIRIREGSIIIPEKLIPHLFNPFLQNINGVSDKVGHIVHALSISKRILELMGGKIEVQATINGGMAVTIFVPIDEKSKQEIVNKSSVFYTVSPEVLYLNELRPYFLVVEDDEGSAKMLEVTLRTVSKIDVVNNGEAALELLKQKSDNGIYYDLILLDIGLPEPWNGIQLRKEIINRFQRYKNIPFIAETAFVLKKDKDKILEAGFDAYISKPIDRRYLIKSLAAVIKRHRGEIADQN